MATAPSIVATLATIDAIQDLNTLLFSLAAFQAKPPKVYIYCDSALAARLPELRYPGKIQYKKALDPYAGKGRAALEATPGETYSSRWFDFMAEKINLLEWVFTAEPVATAAAGVLFCDADICFFGPLPKIPGDVIVALSPHEIRPADELRYGRYNGGFLWLSDRVLLDVWRTACRRGSRFYEQSALEDVAAAVRAADPGGLYEFPREHNYGWWRLFQSPAGPQETQKEWTMNRRTDPAAAGILVAGQPLGSVHTHFWIGPEKDRVTALFNEWVVSWLKRLAPAHPPARRMLGHLRPGAAA